MVGINEIGVGKGTHSMCPPLFVATPSLPASTCHWFAVARSSCPLSSNPILCGSSSLLPCSSSLTRFSISLCSSASFVPSLGRNLRSRLALKVLGLQTIQQYCRQSLVKVLQVLVQMSLQECQLFRLVLS